MNPRQVRRTLATAGPRTAPGARKATSRVDLIDGVMNVTKHAEADHGVATFHKVEFQDGIVELRFKLGEGDDLGVDFVDRELKTVHAGHLCMARVTNKSLTITDSKTGGMDNKIRERRQGGRQVARTRRTAQNQDQDIQG